MVAVGGSVNLNLLGHQQPKRLTEITESQGPSEHVAMTATYQISQPEPFDFASPEEWPKWLRRF